jgi:flagellar protein FlaJ
MSADSVSGAGIGKRRNSLGYVFYPLYARLFDEDSDLISALERKLAEARIDYPVEMYVSQALGIGLLVGLIAWSVGVGAGYLLVSWGVIRNAPIFGLELNEPLLTLVRNLRVPTIILMLGFFFGMLGMGAVLGTAVATPYLRSAERRREINRLLPDGISYMYALSQGGMSQIDIIDAVADADDTYGEFAREFETIIKETEYFDTDYRTAIRRRSIETPSEEFSQFLTDLLSIMDSGGNITRFLDDKKNQHFRTARQEEEEVLDTLELFGEIFITISLFPLLLIIMLVVLQLLGRPLISPLYATTYVLIPFLGLAFLIVVAIIKIDDPGDGWINLDSTGMIDETGRQGLFDRGLVDQYADEYYLFDRIRDRDGTLRTLDILTEPHLFFRDHPLYTVALSLPAAVALIAVAIVTGAAPATWNGLVDRPVVSTTMYVYIPIFLIGGPLALFHEWKQRSRYAVLDGLSDELRKLASANDTGMTFLESVRTVAETSSSRLAEELGIVHTRTQYGMTLEDALIVFNNKYQLPRLARTVKLIAEAQQASNEISSVLSTAAQAVENQEDIQRDRISRTRLQVAIIALVFFTLLGVMAILKTRFIDVVATLTQQEGDQVFGTQFGGAVDRNLLSLLFFHALILQALVAGFVSGYIRDSNLLSGLKYVLGFLGITLIVWMVVG